MSHGLSERYCLVVIMDVPGRNRRPSANRATNVVFRIGSHELAIQHTKATTRMPMLNFSLKSMGGKAETSSRNFFTVSSESGSGLYTLMRMNQQATSERATGMMV